MFLFINRRQDRLKALVWDRTGFVIYYKRLIFGAKRERFVAGQAPANQLNLFNTDTPVKEVAQEQQLIQSVDKYVGHLPLYRLAQRFARHGVKLATSTMGGWITQVAALMAPIYEALKQEALQSGYIQADETRIQVQDSKKKGKTHRGFYWTYHAVEPALVWIDYHHSREYIVPQDTLKEFEGFLQTDAYQAYDKLDIGDGIALFHCWAHARRNFEKALDSDFEKASHALKEIQKLYAIERKLRLVDPSPPNRQAARQEKAVPILEELRQWMDEQKDQCLPKSPMAKALNYCLSRWKHFTLYTEDSRLEIDNNLVENIIRPIALGRKNYLFAGSHEAAQRAAVLYSLLATCKLHDINPYDWLHDVLNRSPTRY